MDREDLSPALLKAGYEYLDALRRLKLQPQGLLWSRVNEIRKVEIGNAGETVDEDFPGNEWRLVLITSLIDEAGPSALNELLFKAYDASATPKEISPFIVEVMSDKAPFVSSLLQALNNPIGPVSMSYRTFTGQEIVQPLDISQGQSMIGGLWFSRKWIYHLTGLREPFASRKRHWREFRQSVNALAA